MNSLHLNLKCFKYPVPMLRGLFGSRSGFFGLCVLSSLSEIAVGIYVCSCLRENKAGASAAFAACRKLITLHGEHLMRHTVLVMRCGINSRCRDSVPRPKGPIRHNLASGWGT